VTTIEYEANSEFTRQAENYHMSAKRKASKLPAMTTLAYTPYKKQLKATNDVDKPEALTRAIVGLDDGLENAGNTLAGLMATYENFVQDLVPRSAPSVQNARTASTPKWTRTASTWTQGWMQHLGITISLQLLVGLRS
jgi:hypothetical protein